MKRESFSAMKHTLFCLLVLLLAGCAQERHGRTDLSPTGDRLIVVDGSFDDWAASDHSPIVADLTWK